MSNELLEFISNHEDAFKSKARLSSLYADFAPLKTTNPDGYDANISAWRSALSKASTHGVAPGSSALTLRSGEKLARALERRDFGRPLALGCVLDEAVAAKELVPLSEFLDAKSSIYRRRWTPNVRLPSAWEAAKWILQAAGIAQPTSSDRLAEGDFVVMPNVEAAAETILDSVNETSTTSTSRVYSLQTFKQAFSNILPSAQILTDNDIRILLTFISRDKNAASISTSKSSNALDNDTEEITIKISPHGSAATPPAPVNDTDRTIASLRTLQLNLDSAIAQLTAQVAQHDSTARAAASTGTKERALAALRAKKLASTTLAKRSASLAQVETTLAAIDDAVGNAAMVRAMDASAKVLAELNAQVGGAEGVAHVMDAVAEQRAETEDVGKVLGEEANEAAGIVDEEEVDNEFEALLAEQESSRGKQEVTKKEKPEVTDEEVTVLPDVPTAEPSTHARAEDRTEEDMEKRLSSLSLVEDTADKETSG